MRLEQIIMKRLISIISVFMLLTSCSNEKIGDCPDSGRENGRSEEIPIKFTISSIGTAETKSSISASETTVRDINIYAYLDGKLEKAAYFESTGSFTVSLIKGHKYNLYALSNMGKLTPPDLEEKMLGTKFSMGPMSYINDGFPMSWSLNGFMVSENSPTVNVQLIRLVSKISFSLDKSAVGNFCVTSVRLCQSASSVYPFAYESRAESPSEVTNGDHASAQDLISINSGKRVSFYAYENCQGVLLPDNVTAESKIPSNIPANSRLCTYLEMTASFSGQYDGVDVSSDNVKYRFYLGADNCSDFNVKRNTDIAINLKVTEDRIFDESWKVSYGDQLPDISYGLEVLPEDIEIGLGNSCPLSANYYRMVDGTRDWNTDVTSYAAWTSGDESVATVSGGVVTGVSKGTVSITATYNGYKVTREITVKDVATYMLTLTPEKLNVGKGRTGKMTAVLATYLNGTQINGSEVSSKCLWTSSDTSVATVNESGLVTGISLGTAVITAEYEGFSVRGTVTVKPVITYGLALTPSSIEIYKGASDSITATYMIYEDNELKSSTIVTESADWSPANAKVVAVDKGKVTGLSLGSTVINVEYNGVSAAAYVVVKGTPSLSMGWSSKALKKGSVTTNLVMYHPNDGTSSENVTSKAVWTTSDAGVATVGGGTITAQGPGTALITASYNGLSAVCVVTVTTDVYVNPNVHVATITASSVNLSGNIWKIKLSLRFSDGTVIDDVPYRWNVKYSQSPDISPSDGKEDPIIYLSGGSSYITEVGITTIGQYKDPSGNTRQLSTSMSFSHNIDWIP